MTLKDILTLENWEQYGDMDVYNDVTDDYACAWCGTICTTYGEGVYQSTLDIPAEIRDDNWLGGGHKCIVVLVDQFEGWEDKWDEASALFSDMAGYIAEEDYVQRFVNDEAPEYKESYMENKQAILNKLLEAFKLTRQLEDLESLTYRTDLVEGLEIVEMKYRNGGTKRVNVTADSGVAMIEDIMKYVY